MLLKVAEITGQYAISAEGGQKLYDLIHSVLLPDRPVELDFTGVKVFSSPFFNHAIGQLLKDFSVDDLNRLVRIVSLTANGQLVLERAIDNAKRYYADSQYKQALDRVLEEYAASL
jgi:hypothetical protein